MPITAITYQPATNALSAAYRPILYRVTATDTAGNTPPLVYCDIYFGGVFYKSLTKTIATASGEWQFDIQDAAQEYLKKYLAPNGGASIYPADQAMTRVFCKFRSSGMSTNGFIEPEGVAPVQGTGNQLPSTGTGTASNNSYVVNSTLQHEDNQVLSAHLNSFKVGTWANNVFPLSHRPAANEIKLGRSDFFPMVNTADSPIKGIVTYYRFKGQATFNQTPKAFDNPCPVVLPTMAIVIEGANYKYRFTWNTMPYYVSGVKIEYRLASSTGAYTIIFSDPNPTSYKEIILSSGSYEFYFTAIGNCTGGRTGYVKS